MSDHLFSEIMKWSVMISFASIATLGVGCVIFMLVEGGKWIWKMLR